MLLALIQNKKKKKLNKITKEIICQRIDIGHRYLQSENNLI